MGETSLAPLTRDAEFREAFALEMSVWRYDDPQDAVAPQMLAALVSAGGLLVGARHSGRLVGFAFSFPAIRDGATIQWSHTLAVGEEFRKAGLARRLKLAQREHALAMGIDRIQWTFDPLQAVNAHFNLHRLGATASRYLPDLYGDSSSPLHRGTPTDRLIADWRLTSERVAALADGRDDVPAPEGAMGDRVSSRLVEIPMGFSELLLESPAEALAVRLATRGAFTSHFARGYRAVDFLLDRHAGSGAYLLAL